MKHLIGFGLASLLLAAACSERHGGGAHSDADSAHSAPGKANAHMHERTPEQLIASFNSPERLAWQKPDVLIGAFGDLSTRTVADLGAGSGYFTFRLAKVAKRVLALEPNPAFVDFLKEQADSLTLTNVEVRSIGYTSTGLRKGEFDDMLLVDVYHHIENRVAYFADLRGQLSASGRVWVVDFKDGKLPVGPGVDHKVPLATVLAELTAAGFATQLDSTLLPYQFIVTARLKN